MEGSREGFNRRLGECKSKGRTEVRILGVDPGFGRTGFGVIEVSGNRYAALEFGCVETVPHSPIGERLREIYMSVSDVLARHKPDAVAIEELFFSRNVTTGLRAAEARGVVVLAAEMAGVEQFEYTPLQVKQAVAGYGRADKRQVQDMVKLLLGLREIPRPDDAADALAVALAHAQGKGYRERVASARERPVRPRETDQ